ncbi:pyruvate kinase [Vulgatibacter incomptus]|uniref:Pyruvate kinase n=1 Tax=Vulgatibacter incomptus TaxID=1391653 RepID=A0A0K1PBW9_9BACT|nr:pyruvate kinase [Vulgatibacter incomptus]AKU91020.1 Pyruvate kinase [Vulgatibacter incomptus]
MRKAKIVCTLGPASDSLEQIEALVRAGMDVARLNFSHGTHRDHERRLGLVREAAQRVGRPVAVLQDLQGPKIRTGKMRGGKITLATGSEVTITTEEVLGTSSRFSTTYAGLVRDVRIGDDVLLADGRIKLTVLKKPKKNEIRCKVTLGGELGNNKGINLPGTKVSAPSLTEKDAADLEFGLAIGVDYVAISFVRTADDVRNVKRIAGERVPIIAKIEMPQAVADIDAIAEIADGIMVARGDLGVELPLERVPLIQKMLIERTNAQGKIVIVATEMLESMIHEARPTRAEVSDVANAVLDGADAVMLSAETASGAHPVEAAATMAAIVQEVERSHRFRSLKPHNLARSDSFSSAVARACCAAAEQLGLDSIAACTQTGRAARLISEHRPAARIFALTPLPETYRRMALCWGVIPLMIPAYSTPDEMLRVVTDVLLREKFAKRGDPVVISSGVPNQPMSTNLMTIHRL